MTKKRDNIRTAKAKALSGGLCALIAAVATIVLNAMGYAIPFDMASTVVGALAAVGAAVAPSEWVEAVEEINEETKDLFGNDDTK